MAKQFFSDMTIVPAVVPTAGAVGSLTATEVNATGWDRACFIIATGAAGVNATLDAKVQESATSGGTFADHSPATDIQLTAATGANKVAAIDLRVNPAKPFLKIVGSVGTTTFANSVICVLYKGTHWNPPTRAASFVQAVEVH